MAASDGSSTSEPKKPIGNLIKFGLWHTVQGGRKVDIKNRQACTADQTGHFKNDEKHWRAIDVHCPVKGRKSIAKVFRHYCLLSVGLLSLMFPTPG